MQCLHSLAVPWQQTYHWQKPLDRQVYFEAVASEQDEAGEQYLQRQFAKECEVHRLKRKGTLLH
jgi:hypothetical protein